MLLAADKGEVDGICGLSWTALTATWGAKFKSGDAVPVLQMSPKKHSALPDVPLAISAWPRPTRRGFSSRRVSMIPPRSLAFTRCLRARRRSAWRVLRTAFMKTMRDPQFLADAKKTRLYIDPSPGEEVLKVVKSLDALSPEVVQKLKGDSLSEEEVAWRGRRAKPYALSLLRSSGPAAYRTRPVRQPTRRETRTWATAKTVDVSHV